MLEKLLKAENKLKQKEEEFDTLVTMFYNLAAENPRPSLASPLQERNVPIRMNRKTEVLGDILRQQRTESSYYVPLFQHLTTMQRLPGR